METPGGQERGAHRFELSLIPFSSDVRNAVPDADAFEAGLRAEVTPIPGDCLPASRSAIGHRPRRPR
jgi:hypothetical protein